MGKQQFNRSLSKDEIQTANKKMSVFSILSHQEKPNQNCTEVLWYSSRNIYGQEDTQQGVLAGGNVGAKGTLDTVEII